MRKNYIINRSALMATTVFALLSVAVLFDKPIFQIIGVMALFLAVFIFNIYEAIQLTVAFTPNLAIVTLSKESIGLIGFLYLLLFFKCQIKSNAKLRINYSMFVPFVYLTFVSLMRVMNGNYYDLFIIIEVFIVILTWNSIFDNGDRLIYKEIYEAYGFGCALMLIGMLLRGLALDTSTTRFMAILDDANFTSMAFIVLFASSLVAFSYKMKVKNKIINIIISLIGGTLTASRGFLVSLGVVILLFVVSGAINKKERKATFFFIIISIAVFIMYLVGVDYIVDLYNNTVGRTLELRNTYSNGSFMDVTSGRLYLWQYYINYIKKGKWILLFGRGFQGYYLIENGGYYNMSAHNSYIASVIAVGVIGTFMLFKAYFSIWKGRLFIERGNRGFAFISIFIGTAVGYFFLDGILDLRYIMSIVMVLTMYKIYYHENNSVALEDM